MHETANTDYDYLKPEGNNVCKMHGKQCHINKINYAIKSDYALLCVLLLLLFLYLFFFFNFNCILFPLMWVMTHTSYEQRGTLKPLHKLALPQFPQHLL